MVGGLTLAACAQQQPVPQTGVPVTPRGLKASCAIDEAGQAGPNVNACLTYLMAFDHGYQAHKFSGGRDWGRYCIPQDQSMTAILAKFGHELAKDPSVESAAKPEATAPAVLFALTRAFPCPRSED